MPQPTAFSPLHLTNQTKLRYILPNRSLKEFAKYATTIFQFTVIVHQHTEQFNFRFLESFVVSIEKIN